VRGIKIKFDSHYAERGASRLDKQARRVDLIWRGRVFHSSTMDSDEEMQQIDSELPSFSSAAKGKGKAVSQDEFEDPAGGRDDTLPWYMKSLSRPR
jgi:hypothetical protein